MIYAIAFLIIAATPGPQAPSDLPPQVGASTQRALTADEVSEIQARAAKGDPQAELRLARALMLGDGVSKDPGKAVAWYREAADSGNPEAQDAMGIIYMSGDGVDRDKAAAVAWYQKAARQGNADAMFNLGTAYYNGDGVAVDDAWAFAWFTLAKQAGSQDATNALETTQSDRKPWTAANAYKDVAGLYAKDGLFGNKPTEAARWWLLSAQAGDPDAQIITADIYLNGRGVPQDLAQGRHWCEEAAKVDDQRAFFCLGEIYRRGLSVPKNPKLARSWYERSARQRSAAAIRALAEMDATGEGGKRDLESAYVEYAVLVVALGEKADAFRLAALKAQIDPNDWKKVEDRLAKLKVDSSKLEAALKSAGAQ